LLRPAWATTLPTRSPTSVWAEFLYGSRMASSGVAAQAQAESTLGRALGGLSRSPRPRTVSPPDGASTTAMFARITHASRPSRRRSSRRSSTSRRPSISRSTSQRCERRSLSTSRRSRSRWRVSLTKQDRQQRSRRRPGNRPHRTAGPARHTRAWDSASRRQLRPARRRSPCAAPARRAPAGAVGDDRQASAPRSGDQTERSPRRHQSRRCAAVGRAARPGQQGKECEPDRPTSSARTTERPCPPGGQPQR
jgi:hypothetical protein